MARRRKKLPPTPPDLDLDFPIRTWVYENVGLLFEAIPEDANGDGADEPIQFDGGRFEDQMTAFSGTLEAVESLLELFPLEDRTRVENDLLRLFASPDAGVAAPPYASWYLDGKLRGAATEWVVGEYRAQGLESDEAGEPLDRISTEFEFMEFLCGQEMAARSAENDEALAPVLAAQGRFVEHLARWLPKLAQAIRKSDPTPYFARVARILEIFSEEELAYVNRR